MEYITEIPFEGYAEAYLHTFKECCISLKTNKDKIKDVQEIVLGQPYKDPKDKPKFMEFDNSCNKHLGTVKITITSDDPKLNGVKVDASRI
jgi:hypothetical protein